MARRIGPTKIKQYSLEFKLKAVQLSGQPGVLIKDVAESRKRPLNLSITHKLK